MKYVISLIFSLLTILSFAQAPAVEIRRGMWQLFVVTDTNKLKPPPIYDSTWMKDMDTIRYPYPVYVTQTVHDTMWQVGTGWSPVKPVGTTVPPVVNLVSIFTTQTLPTVLNNDGDGGIELGVKFSASIAGFIRGVRFYKVAGNTGAHTGQLYSSTGTLLATASFIETASGWQNVIFTNPVPIVAGTIYVAGYYSPQGFYSATLNALTNEISNSPLTSASGTTGLNGLYKKGPAPALPVNSYQKSNYWVDVIYSSN